MKYNLDTKSLPNVMGCYLLRVTVRDALTGEEGSEAVLLERR